MARARDAVMADLGSEAAAVAIPAEPKSHSELVAVKIGRGEIPGLLTGVAAMKACGAQSEFIAHCALQAKALDVPLILRAGDPPQYNKHRSPKSGVNLSKTSKQGLFKGALAKELRFARLEDDGTPKPHHAKDAAHLALPPTDPDYQHTMHLDINMHDILREIGPAGDLEVLGYNQHNGQLRLGYKAGHGPDPAIFNGQFVVNLHIDDKSPQFFSRPWDRPEASPHWDAERQVITKPAALHMIPDAIYQEVFHSSFKVNYTETKTASPDITELQRCDVFANRARDAESFKDTVDMLAAKNPGSAWPKVKKLLDDNIKDNHLDIKKMELGDILTLLKNQSDILQRAAELGPLPGAVDDEEMMGWTFDPDIVIRTVYDVSGSIVAGDWDGMALGHPPHLKAEYMQVYNTFAAPPEGQQNMDGLMYASNCYLRDIKNAARLKPEAERTAFENKALSIGWMQDFVSDFALARAGCITPHEFVFQQVLNHAYRDEANAHYGEKYDSASLQTSMNILLEQHFRGGYSQAGQYARVQRVLEAELRKGLSDGEPIPVTQPLFEKMITHLNKHLTKAIQEGKSKYSLPHMDHDMNVHNLFQHGFDMRNPYGSNLEGPWLLVNSDGMVFAGDKQEQLIEFMLTGNFLEETLIDVSHGADMSTGWDRVIAKQIELGQDIPDKTISKYNAYRVEQALAEGRPIPDDIKLMDVNLDHFEMSHGWDRLLPQLLANHYVISFDLDQKRQAHFALQEVKAGRAIAEVPPDAKMSVGWDKVIEAQIEKGQAAVINPATAMAYQAYKALPKVDDPLAEEELHVAARI